MSDLHEKAQELQFLLALRNSSKTTVMLLANIQTQLDSLEQHQKGMLQVADNWMNVFKLANLVDVVESDIHDAESSEIADPVDQVLLIPLTQ